MTVIFRPALAGTGVVFVRSDLEGQPEIPALIHHRVQSLRRTALMCNGHKVEMVEHILSALVGLQIDNCYVDVNRVEMPGMDGSSIAFTSTSVSRTYRAGSAAKADRVGYADSH